MSYAQIMFDWSIYILDYTVDSLIFDSILHIQF